MGEIKNLLIRVARPIARVLGKEQLDRGILPERDRPRVTAREQTVDPWEQLSELHSATSRRRAVLRSARSPPRLRTVPRCRLLVVDRADSEKVQRFVRSGRCCLICR
jgi:hypothetical protein